MLTIDIQTARRFILGKQGLWPGRRWRGIKGTEQAMRAIEYLQLDPLQIIARSHDITLHSRVLDYKPDMWETVTYKKRKFFDWGGWLAARPMDELPYWRTVMHRERDGDYGDRRIRLIARQHAKAIAEMRVILRERGNVSNRDFDKDSATALYYLWQTGEAMTHHRDHFERVYALTEKIAPAHLIRESSGADTDRFLIKKEVSCSGLARIKRTGEAWGRGEPDRAAKKMLEAMLTDEELIEVQVEGWKMNHYAL